MFTQRTLVDIHSDMGMFTPWKSFIGLFHTLNTSQNQPKVFLYLSIHPFSIPAQSNCGGAGAYLSDHREAGYTLDRSPVHHRATQRQTRQTTTHTHTHTHTHTLRDNLQSPINLTCTFLDGGRKPEYPERTHAYTGRARKLHTERPQVGIEPGTLSLLTTTPPCSPRFPYLKGLNS